MEFTFFTMNDFTKEGGGTIRIHGVISELVKQGHQVTLLSNAKTTAGFEPGINHININFEINPGDKGLLQALTGLLPAWAVALKYKPLLADIDSIIRVYNLKDEPIYFCEYLDNTIGYLLKANGIINSYINDLHGIAPLEFKFKARHAGSLLSKIKFLNKYYTASLLDSKVFNNASGLIFASKAMQQHFYNLYPQIAKKQNYILPYVLSPSACLQAVNQALKTKIITDLSLQKEDKIVLFTGAFKQTGGVPDLINAFANLASQYGNLRLILVGDGPTMGECVKTVKERRITDTVFFIGRTPYADLRTYQDLADVIVCPDKMNMYSELIIHVKYLDALISGKVVVNGSFKSVMEINTNDSLSVSFEPSNIESLTNAIKYAIDNLDVLKQRYINNSNYTCNNLTYSNFVSVLTKANTNKW